MKLQFNDIANIANNIREITNQLNDMYIVFPIDQIEQATDEFGIEITKYKAETRYGNLLVPVIAAVKTENETKVVLGYASTTDLIAFNMSDFLNLANESKSKMRSSMILPLAHYECCIAPKVSVHLTSCEY